MKFTLKNYQVNTWFKGGVFHLVTKLYEVGTGTTTRFITTVTFDNIKDARLWLKQEWLGRPITVAKVYASSDWKVNGEVL